MMTREDRQEALSLAYIKAVAAVCGMTHSVPSRDYGIDLTLNEVLQRGGRFSETGLRLDIQAKSTTSAIETRTAVGFDLGVKAYDDLRADSPHPRVLGLLLLPADETLWLKQSRRKLELHGCLYWVSLRGQPRVPNRSTVRVAIPRHQMFTPDGLREIMSRVRSGRGL